MSTTTTTVAWNKAKDQVLSWIENEHHCVTAQRISQSLDLSRKQGSLLLQEILQEKPSFKTTSCDRIKQENVTVFRLRTSPKTPQEDDTMTTIVALASPEATESVATAHERDMVQLREMVADGNPLSEGAILPAEPMETIKDQTAQRNRVVDPNGAPARAAAAAAAPIHKPFANAKSKPTTAASFFSKQKELAKKEERSKETSRRQGEEKENTVVVHNKNIDRKKAKVPPAKKVGNADDFVGDIEDSDDDDDDDDVVVVRKTTNIPKKEPTPPPSPVLQQQPPSPVRGAIDAFAEKDPNRKRKRRKRMVEKTTMVNGYLRTETVAVWEDVPSDEENAAEQKLLQERITKPKTKPSGSGKSSKQPMKQTGLMGFFKKK